MQRQLAALHLGAVAIDMEMDTFDPHPAPALQTPEAAEAMETPGEAFELTNDPGAVRRQREVIDEAHLAGAEVLLSCHTGRPQSAEQLLAIGRKAVERGADLLKIVTPCRNTRDLLSVFEATIALRCALPIPFVLVGAGKAGLLSRSIGAHFGSSWVIAQTERNPDGFPDQPLVEEAREVMRLTSPPTPLRRGEGEIPREGGETPSPAKERAGVRS
jgi:hypothetical protein